jgi:hypothetical protein
MRAPAKREVLLVRGWAAVTEATVDGTGTVMGGTQLGNTTVTTARRGAHRLAHLNPMKEQA